VASTVNLLDPFSPFEDGKAYYDDPKNLVYYQSVWNAIIADLEKNKIIPAGIVKTDDVVWGGDIWHQMVDYKTKTDALFTKLGTATLSDDKKALLDKAKTFYADFDFLDSYRLALAASA